MWPSLANAARHHGQAGTRRIPGDSTVFHLQYLDGRLWPVVIWKLNEDVATCPAVNCAAASELADAVAGAKRLAGGDGGGAFLIDEFGNVIVPASDGGGRRFLAGHFRGPLMFENSHVPGERVHLGCDGHLQPGDPWKLPYVGMPYHLHRSGSIYFYQLDGGGGRSIYPQQQDHGLVRAIREIRPHGAVRLLVTLAGSVLTKVPLGAGQESEESWQPVYVGSINWNLWFDKE